MRASSITQALASILPFSFLNAAILVVILSCTQLVHAIIPHQQQQNEISMGTTILAVRYNGGVVVGADTRTSVSGYVSNRYAAKLTFVLDRNVDNFVTTSNKVHHVTEGSEYKDDASTCVICRSGSAADTQHLASVVRTDLVSRQLLYRIRGTVTHVASLVRNILLNNDLSASLICAGYDHELCRGVIYTITPGGTIFEERTWAVGGSGSTYVLGHLDSTYPKEEERDEVQLLQSEEEAVQFVSDAITLAMERDGSSGGFIRMYVIDRNGKRFISRMPKHVVMDGSKLDQGMAGDGRRGRLGEQSTVSVSKFAPAISPVQKNSGLSK